MKKKPEIVKEDLPSSSQVLPRRLCSEIQLFDLCELTRCHFKDERYCTDPEMIARFEAVAEPEDRPLNLAEDDDDDEIFEEEPDEFDEDDYSVFEEDDDIERLDRSNW